MMTDPTPRELREEAEKRRLLAYERAHETENLVAKLRRIREMNNFAYNIRKAMGG